MSTYLTINLIIVAVPLALTFLPVFRFYRKWRPLLASIVIVGGLFIFWDALFTIRGDWTFNPLYVNGLKVLSLPPEEWLFFFTVPYSCLFLYEGISAIVLDIKIFYSSAFYVLLSGLSLYAAWMFRGKEYTLVVSLLSAAVFLLGASRLRYIFTSRVYWIWITLGMGLFVVFNHFLAALPVVIYSPLAITNFRLASIPIEDFFYNYCLLTLYLAIYIRVKNLASH